MKKFNGLGLAPVTLCSYIVLFISADSLVAGPDISPPASGSHNKVCLCGRTIPDDTTNSPLIVMHTISTGQRAGGADHSDCQAG
jgi:hypothetical protein